MRQLAYKRCIECHRDVRAEITKPSHHPIIEGKVGCQDCHDPHGSLTKASLRGDSIVDLCTSCHARAVDSEQQVIMNLKVQCARIG